MRPIAGAGGVGKVCWMIGFEPHHQSIAVDIDALDPFEDRLAIKVVRNIGCEGHILCGPMFL